MAKVVYNACFGGFSLSREAVLLARELSGNAKWGGSCIVGDIYDDGSGVCGHDYGIIEGVARTDPILVSVVEKLGDDANGYCAKLRICELPSGTLYRIDEYDGRESIQTKETYDWEVAP